ncbi:MDR family MFS transporter [Geochorda subterranea]|uniref:MDR family MFS transporter n=1 Tax=Geochorda subterranea TaxID=3109564 RepID=A0ABZ1BSI4_9FIRM|nr:MDR family MFS transporter [Limnochorda sp. LNt]WRP15591.1 MDR family MFS transporter [Limnochorda sp. LNt]
MEDVTLGQRLDARSGDGASTPAAVTNRITGSRRWWALGAVMVSMFFSSLDQTIVSAAMPVIIGELHGFGLYAWVFTAYMMASAITVPIYGKLSDVYGRRPFYVFGLVTFMTGSVLAGLARDMGWLVAARALQGVGGGALLSMPPATIGDIFNPRERARWMGLVMTLFGVSSIVGPTLGGWITDHLGWRWVFYVNLPVGLAALAAVSYALPTVRLPGQARVDWAGSALLVAGLVPLLLALTWAGSTYPWGSPRVLGAFGVAALALAGFLWVEQRTPDPLLSPALLSHPVFLSAASVALLASVTMFSGVMFMPLFAQGVLGISAEGSGIVMTPMMLSFIAGSALSGQILSRTGRYKVQAVVAAGVVIVGTALLRRMGVDAAPPDVVRNVVTLGLGIGSLMPLVNVAVQNAFPYRMLGTVNATQQFVRSLGGVLAAPIFGTILTRGFQRSLEQRLSAPVAGVVGQMSLDPQALITAEAQERVRAVLASMGGEGEQMARTFVEALRQALADGMAGIFAVGWWLALATLAATLWLKEIPLKRDEFYREEGGS